MAEFDPYLSWLGIPASQKPPTAYQLLAIDPTITDPAVIKALSLQRAAYVRNFQKGEHGDRCSKMLEELAQAEATLADPIKRAAYDRSLKPASPAAPKPSPPKPAPAAAPPKPKPAPVPVVALPVEAVPKRRRSRAARRNSELVLVLGWVGGGVALVVGLAVLVSVLRSRGGQPTASNADAISAPSAAKANTSTPSPSKPQENVATTKQQEPPPSNASPYPAAGSRFNSRPAILKISFEVPVYDWRVTIDGALKQGPALSFPLAEGEHSVVIMKGETMRFETRVVLRAGETHELRVALSSFKAWEAEPDPGEAPAKRVVNLPPHDPEEVVVARYLVEPEAAVTLLKGNVAVTHSGRFYEFKGRWKEFDDGVEFHVVQESRGRTIAVDPRIVGRECYQVIAPRPGNLELDTLRKENNTKRQIRATFHLVHKSGSVRVAQGVAKIVEGGEVRQVFGTLPAFEDGVEVEFTCPGFLPLVLRVDPEQLGRSNIIVVQLKPDGTSKKASKPKRK